LPIHGPKLTAWRPEPVAQDPERQRTGAGSVHNKAECPRVRAGNPNPTTPVPPAVVERYEYDPYGRTYIESGDSTVRRAVSKYGNPFAWTGQRYDAGVKLYGFFARAYSPELGRWLQRDPLGFVDGVNLYEYVSSSPLNWIDPLGLQESPQVCPVDRGPDVKPLPGGWRRVGEEGGTIISKRRVMRRRFTHKQDGKGAAGRTETYNEESSSETSDGNEHTDSEGRKHDGGIEIKPFGVGGELGGEASQEKSDSS